MHEILAALEGVDSMTIGGLEKTVNLQRGRIAQALKLLELDGAVARERGRYFADAEPVDAGRGADRAGHRRAPARARSRCRPT